MMRAGNGNEAHSFLVAVGHEANPIIGTVGLLKARDHPAADLVQERAPHNAGEAVNHSNIAGFGFSASVNFRVHKIRDTVSADQLAEIVRSFVNVIPPVPL